jgi:CMP/dCMP kinase
VIESRSEGAVITSTDETRQVSRVSSEDWGVPVSEVRPWSSGIVVAIDGPSGSGKSSTSRGVADELGLRYLDTGAQYRAMTWWMLEHGVDLTDDRAVVEASRWPRLVSGTDPEAPTISVDGRRVDAEIRSARVTAAVSRVAGVQAVRTRLIESQREYIRTALAEGPGIVAEGRDIAEVVWPQARTKIYLTADQSVRAARREAENGSRGDVAGTLADLARRDAEDAHTTRPLDAAPGAVVVDGTHLSLTEVVAAIVGIAAAATG